MRKISSAGCLFFGFALCQGGCGQQPVTTNGAANDVADGNAAAAASMICMFEKGDTRNWSGKANADQSVTVSGEAHVTDPKYQAKLFSPQVQGGEARVYVTQAENKGGNGPADGWWPVTFTIPDDGSIQNVGVWCDFDTQFASIPVRRGERPAAVGATAVAARVPFRGCVVRSELGSGCLAVKSGNGVTYELYSGGALPDPNQRLVVEGWGNTGGVSTCMVGAPLSNVEWHYTKAKCDERNGG